jgi:DnaJ-class molecular chaperone
MNVSKNYYIILDVSKNSTEKEIKKSYYNLSKQYHPDKNKDVDISKFNEITEAYNVLCSDERSDYDLKSKFGNNYNEYYELFEIKVDIDYDTEKERFETFKKNDVYNIQVKVDDTFNGSLEYERWVKCKTCDGTGKDLSAKIVIRDINGNITKIFDADDGCDFCDGTGKDYKGDDCHFCSGKGKVGLTPCGNCKGEKRILGKQKLTGIKLTGKETKVEAMGHFAKNEPGKVGYLLILS